MLLPPAGWNTGVPRDGGRAGRMETDVMTLAAETVRPSDELAAAVGATLQNIAKLKGRVTFASPGSLPNDGKVIADERKYD